jgi:hypothetical protein
MRKETLMSKQFLCSLSLLAVVCVSGTDRAYAQSSNQPKGCPLEVAVQQVDRFADSRMNQLAKATMPLLDQMDAVTRKATKPGISLGEQLSSKDRDQFNALRHMLIQIDVERLKTSDFQRDVHLIFDTYKVAELADFYETQIESLGDADPRRFYFIILQGLRGVQPRTPRTPLVGVGIDCDPEAGLFFQEEFYQRELTKTGADQHMVNLVFDIERLRTLYQLCWNLFNKGLDDVRATTWKDDTPNSPDSITPMISVSSAATQSMFKVIIPYIDQQLPSKVALEARFKAKQRREAEQDYPVQQQR